MNNRLCSVVCIYTIGAFIKLISLSNVSTVSAFSPDYTIRVCKVSRMTIFHALLPALCIRPSRGPDRFSEFGWLDPSRPLVSQANVNTNLRNPVASLFSGRGCLVCAFLDCHCLISFICGSYAKSQSLSHIPIHPLSSSINPNPHHVMPYLDLRELNALTQLANRGGLGSAIAYVLLTHVHKSS